MRNFTLNHNQQITLLILQQLRIGQYLKISIIARRDPAKFIMIVKELIDLGFSEYEFTKDYKEVKRLDLPEYAKDFFTKLYQDYE